MRSAEPLGLAAGARIGATFRLLMQLRVLIVAVTVLLVSDDRRTHGVIFVLACVGALSALAQFGWQEIVPRLLGHPVLLALDALVAYSALEIGGVLGPFFLFTVVTSTVAGLLYRRLGMLLICALQVGLYYAAAAGPDQVITFQTVLGMPLCYFIAGFVGIALRRLFDENAAAEEALRRAEVAAAAAEERARLAREMHDSLAKTLRGISMSAVALPLWVARDPERAGEEARRLASAVETASREARELLTELRDGAAARPLGEAVRAIVTAWSASSGLPAAVTAPPGADLPPRARHEVVAILREALENVERHARAASVEVRLAEADGGLVLSVRDDGRGFTVPGDAAEFSRAGRYGVIGMRERAAEAGARLAVESAPGAGTTVRVVLPAGAAEDRSRGTLEVA